MLWLRKLQLKEHRTQFTSRLGDIHKNYVLRNLWRLFKHFLECVCSPPSKIMWWSYNDWACFTRLGPVAVFHSP